MKKILFVAAVLALGFTNANAQYDSRYDRHDNRVTTILNIQMEGVDIRKAVIQKLIIYKERLANALMPGFNEEHFLQERQMY